MVLVTKTFELSLVFGSQSIKRELISASSPLISMYMPSHICGHINKHALNKYMNAHALT